MFNGTNETVQANWRPEPTFRGTYGILSTCIITTLLCIWTAVHLNVPAYKKGSRQTWRKVGWFIMGLIAPEMVGLRLAVVFQSLDAAENMC